MSNCCLRGVITLCAILYGLGGSLGPAAAQTGVYTPKAGSTERKAIMDALRVLVERELKQNVIFQVQTLRLEDGWAFLKGTPEQPNGHPIDLKVERGSGSDGTIAALLHNESGGWRVLTHALGSAKSAARWSRSYHAPQAIFDAVAPSPAGPTDSNVLYTPKAGSAERKAMMDLLRGPIERKLKQSVIFEVKTLHAQSGWAFLYGIPRRPGGGPIDYSRTPYREAVKAGGFGDDVSALYHRVNGQWRLVTSNLGATDVAWATWDRDYHAPSAIFKLENQ